MEMYNDIIRVFFFLFLDFNFTFSLKQIITLIIRNLPAGLFFVFKYVPSTASLHLAYSDPRL
jgi:hypothetical protein